MKCSMHPLVGWKFSLIKMFLQLHVQVLVFLNIVALLLFIMPLLFVAIRHKFDWLCVQPFKPRYPHTNFPNWSPYIFLKTVFDKRSKHFSLLVILLILLTFSLDYVWISLGENWCWSSLGLKGYKVNIDRSCFWIKCLRRIISWLNPELCWTLKI